jgi:hypothetical protein
MKSFKAKYVSFILFILLILILSISCVSFGDPKYSAVKGKTTITVFKVTTEPITPEFNYITVTFKIKYLEYSSINFAAKAVDDKGNKYSDIGKYADEQAIIDAITGENLAVAQSKYNFYEKDMTDGESYFVVPKALKLKSIQFSEIGPIDISSLQK